MQRLSPCYSCDLETTTGQGVITRLDRHYGPWGGGNDEMTPHGFRAMASTILDHKGYKQEWLRRQLAHEEPNKVKAAYKLDAWRMYLS